MLPPGAATSDPGAFHQRQYQPAATGDHEDPAIHVAGLLIHDARRARALFLGLEPVPGRQQVFITKRFYGGNKDESEIVRPESSEKKPAKAAANASARSAKSSGVNHGSRRPVSNPPKKRKKKPEPTSNGTGPRKGKIADKRDPQPRQHSKRVTQRSPTRPTPRQSAVARTRRRRIRWSG